MSTKDLIPVKKGSREAVELGRLGGLANKNNPKTIRSAKLREIKKRVANNQLKTTDEEWLLERVTNKETMSIDLIDWIDQVRRETGGLSPALLSIYKEAMKAIHGEKHNVDVSGTIKHEINIQLIVEPVDKIKKVDGKEED